MFSLFKPNQQQAPISQRPKGKLSLVLQKIKITHPEFDQESFSNQRLLIVRFLSNGKRNFDGIFNYILKIPYMDIYETQYNLLGEMLDYISESDPENYIDTLSFAFKRVDEHCFSTRINRFLPFAKMLLQQAKNIDSTNEEHLQRYLSLLMNLDKQFYCHINTLVSCTRSGTLEEIIEKDNEFATHSGGEEACYVITQAWSHRVQIESARQGFELIGDFFIKIIRSVGYNLKELSNQQAISHFINIYQLTDDPNHLRDVSQRLLVLWENQCMYEKKVLDLLYEHMPNDDQAVAVKPFSSKVQQPPAQQ